MGRNGPRCPQCGSEPSRAPTSSSPQATGGLGQDQGAHPGGTGRSHTGGLVRRQQQELLYQRRDLASLSWKENSWRSMYIFLLVIHFLSLFRVLYFDSAPFLSFGPETMLQIFYFAHILIPFAPTVSFLKSPCDHVLLYRAGDSQFFSVGRRTQAGLSSGGPRFSRQLLHRLLATGSSTLCKIKASGDLPTVIATQRCTRQPQRRRYINSTPKASSMPERLWPSATNPRISAIAVSALITVLRLANSCDSSTTGNTTAIL